MRDDHWCGRRTAHRPHWRWGLDADGEHGHGRFCVGLSCALMLNQWSRELEARTPSDASYAPLKHGPTAKPKRRR